jgi:hypothetical protein
MSDDGTYKVVKFPRNTPKEEFLRDLRRVASETGRDTVTRQEYDERGKYHSSTIQRSFKGWFNALKEAGLKESRVLGVTDEEYFKNIEEVWRKLGRQPKYAEMTKPFSQYSAGTYEKKYGSWYQALDAFSKYIDGEDLSAVEAMQDHTPTRRTPRNISWRLRARVLIRDNCICKMCGASPAKNPEVELHVDHIVPWSKGGETWIDNLQTLCSVCNIGKSNVVY